MPAVSESSRNSGASVLGTVVVADPDAVLRRAIGEVLARAGYRVLALADDAPEALSLARKLSPDVLVIGQLPGSDAALKTVRAVAAQDLAAVVLLSAIPDVEAIRAARGAGVDTMLGRPPREADLVAAVEIGRCRRRDLRELRGEISGLKDQLQSSAVIQQAKEMLMRRDDISDAEAGERLSRQAERSGRPVKAIAEAVLLAAQVAPAA